MKHFCQQVYPSPTKLWGMGWSWSIEVCVSLGQGQITMTRYDWYSNGLMTWYRILCELLLIPACPNHWLKFFIKEQLVQSVYFGHFDLSDCVKNLCQKGLNWKRLLCTICPACVADVGKGRAGIPKRLPRIPPIKAKQYSHFFFRDIFVQWACMNSESKARPSLTSLCWCPPYISMISVYNVSPPKKRKEKNCGSCKKNPVSF